LRLFGITVRGNGKAQIFAQCGMMKFSIEIAAFFKARENFGRKIVKALAAHLHSEDEAIGRTFIEPFDDAICYFVITADKIAMCVFE